MFPHARAMASCRLVAQQINGRRLINTQRTAQKAGEVGFIGLGQMGAHMARNLIKNGHKLVVFDVNKAVTSSFKDLGCGVAASPAEVAKHTEQIITMLPSSPHVNSVYTGENGIFTTVQSGSLLIDASTIDPSVTKHVGAEAASRKCDFVDAPVSGGVGGAEAGTLTFMVGGSDEAFLKSQVLLGHMGKNIQHCGALGTGQAAKICNNMLLGISMIGVSETMALGVRLGIDPKLLAGILNTSSGRCWSSDTYNPCPGVLEGVPSSRGYTGGFASALMKKDLGLAASAAMDSGASTPMGTLALSMYQMICNQGHASSDFSVAFKFLAEGKKQ